MATEKRLIDANALMDNGIRVEYGFSDNGLILVPMRDVRKSIQNAPTVDAVEVVRCKDCKMRHPDVKHCTLTGVPVSGDDFCSFGEVKKS